jgi:hypothetical protein
VIDVSTPSSPSEEDSLSLGDTVRDLALGNDNDYVFVVGDNNNPEFEVVDISTPTSATSIGQLNTAGDLNGVAYSESLDRAFVVGDANNQEFTVVAPQ